MLSKYAIIGLAIVAFCLSVMSILFMSRSRRDLDLEPAEPLVLPPPPPETTTPAPTAPDYDEPDLQNIRVGGMTSILYPRVPLMEFRYRPRQWELVPGAIIPGMEGRRVEDATHVISTTYPGVTVRVVSHTDPLGLEVRRDRVTLSIDLYTKRVIAARIG